MPRFEEGDWVYIKDAGGDIGQIHHAIKVGTIGRVTGVFTDGSLRVEGTSRYNESNEDGEISQYVSMSSVKRV